MQMAVYNLKSELRGLEEKLLLGEITEEHYAKEVADINTIIVDLCNVEITPKRNYRTAKRNFSIENERNEELKYELESYSYNQYYA